MLRFIENLRSKPESERKKILIALVVVFMLLVVFLWITNLDRIFSVASVNKDNDAKISGVSPFKIFSDKILYMKDTISGGEIK